MFIIISSVVILTLGIFIRFILSRRSVSCIHRDALNMIGGFIMLSGLLLIITCIVSIAFTRKVMSDQTMEFGIAALAVSHAKETFNERKLTSLQSDIDEKNKWLTRTKKTNTGLFDWWIPDDIDKLELINKQY